MNPSITILGGHVIVPSEVIILNSIVLPHKEPQLYVFTVDSQKSSKAWQKNCFSRQEISVRDNKLSLFIIRCQPLLIFTKSFINYLFRLHLYGVKFKFILLKIYVSGQMSMVLMFWSFQLVPELIIKKNCSAEKYISTSNQREMILLRRHQT